MNPDFTDLLDLFIEHEVRFLVVGGVALAAHGLPRATGDLDVWISPDVVNAERVYAALVAFGAPLDDLGVTVDDFATVGATTQFGLPPRRIDILTAAEALDFDEAWQHRFRTEMFGRTVPFLALEDMLRNKESLRRDKDLGDIRAIRRELVRRKGG